MCAKDLDRDGGVVSAQRAREFAGRYTNIRLRADRMRDLLAQLPDKAVITLIVRTDYLPDSATDAQQDDYPATPPDQRVDKVRCK